MALLLRLLPGSLTYVCGLGVRNETGTIPGLFYMRARFYASDLGRFISP